MKLSETIKDGEHRVKREYEAPTVADVRALYEIKHPVDPLILGAITTPLSKKEITDIFGAKKPKKRSRK